MSRTTCTPAPINWWFPDRVSLGLIDVFAEVSDQLTQRIGSTMASSTGGVAGDCHIARDAIGHRKVVLRDRLLWAVCARRGSAVWRRISKLAVNGPLTRTRRKAACPG